MSDGNIINALNIRLGSFDGGVWVNKIEYANAQGFIPPDGAIFLRQRVYFFEPAMIGAGPQGHYRIQGTYTIGVIVPKGQGLIAGTDVAARLVSHFPRGEVFSYEGTGVKVEKSYHSYEVEEANHLQIPVSVRFWSYQSYSD